MSAQKTLDHSFNDRKHPARQAAEDLFDKMKKGTSTLIYKASQAGASTGTISVAADRPGRIVVIGPTKISVTEVLESAMPYCETKNQYLGDISCKQMEYMLRREEGEWGCRSSYQDWIPIPGNDRCEDYKPLVEKYPALKEIPLPLEDCSEKKCKNWGTCECSRVLTAKNTKVIGITKAKLCADLITAERDKKRNEERTSKNKEKKESLGTLQLREVVKGDVYIWDECHAQFEKPDSRHLEIYNVSDAIGLNLQTRFSSLLNTATGTWESCKKIINIAETILSSPVVREKTGELIEKSKTDTAYSEMLTYNIKNPGYIDMEDIENLDFFMGSTEEWKDLIISIGEENPLGMKNTDVMLLRDLFYAIGCPKLNLLQYQDCGRDYVGFTVVDHFTDCLFKKFIRDRNDKYHTNIAISATIGSFDYNSLLPYGKKWKCEKFGKSGDPTGSCKRQVIIPDTFSLRGIGRYALFAIMDETMARVANILTQHGTHDCVIVASSAREMELIKKHPLIQGRGVIVDYYRSPRTMSTKYYYWIDHEKYYPRVMICVGGAETPSHCADFRAKNVIQSKQMRKVEINQTLYQTWGRVKNAGNCLIYCIGINEETVAGAIMWGKDYKVECTKKGRQFTYKTTVSEQLAYPIVRKCVDDYERLAVGREHMYCVFPVVPIPNLSIINKTRTENPSEKTLQPCRIVNVLWYSYSLCKKPLSSAAFNTKYNNELFNSMPLLYDIRAFGYINTLTNKQYRVQEDGWYLHSWEVGGRTFTICHDFGHGTGALKTNTVSAIGPITACKSRNRKVQESEALELVLDNAMLRMKISQCDFTYTDGRLFVWECFCHCKSIFAKQTYIKKQKKWGWYPVKKYDQVKRMYIELVPFQQSHIHRHMKGENTYGMYSIADDDTVTNICFDIDAHFNKDAGMTETEYEQIKTDAEQYLARLTNYFFSHGIPFVLEKSGSEGSYHVWLVCKPVRAAIAHWFGNAIISYLGYQGNEMNPKQATITEKKTSKQRPNGYDVGNLVKIPLGKNMKNNRWSYVYIDGYWMRFDVIRDVWIDEDGVAEGRPQSINVRTIDICEMEIPSEAEPSPEQKETINTRQLKGIGDYRKEYADEPDYVAPDGTVFVVANVVNSYVGTKVNNVRPIFTWALDQDLNGAEGHSMRTFVAREYYNAGYSVDEVAKLFCKQGDYNEAISIDYIQKLTAEECGNVRYSTLQSRCPRLVRKFEEEI